MKNARKVTRKMKKVVLVLGLTIGMVISPLNVLAEETERETEYVEVVCGENMVQPLTISASVTPRLSISGGNASVSTSVSGAGINKISLTMKLQKKTSSGWDTVKSWSASKESSSLSLSKSASISKGTYRTYAKVTCTKSGKNETKSYSSTSKKY